MAHNGSTNNQRVRNNFGELSDALKMVFEVASEGLLRPQAPFALIQDAFEALPIKACREWFDFIESNTDNLRAVCQLPNSPNLQTMALSIKMNLVKSVNATAIRAFCSLLKRLSRNSDAPFCGRILLMLSKVFLIYFVLTF